MMFNNSYKKTTQGEERGRKQTHYKRYSQQNHGCEKQVGNGEGEIVGGEEEGCNMMERADTRQQKDCRFLKKKALRSRFQMDR